MELADVARLYASNTVWRTTGAHPAGRALIRALGSKDESQRALAGMFLVQAGGRAVPLLQEALTNHEHVPIVLTILADIGDRRFEPLVRGYTQDADPQVARAAKDALETLHVQQQLRSRAGGH